MIKYLWKKQNQSRLGSEECHTYADNVGMISA
jgi:hypothetical protein